MTVAGAKGHDWLVGDGFDTGYAQSPINLKTEIPVKADFMDKDFEFSYTPFRPAQKKKFDEKNDRFEFLLNNKDWLKTSTVGLFDPQLSGRNVMFSAKNVHFHAPSEHSINGKIADLEMHVVHKI